MALTLNNLVGFETGGLEEALATSGAPLLVESLPAPHAGDYCLQFQAAGTYALPMATGGTSISADMVIGLLVQFDDATPATPGAFFVARDDADATLWSLYLQSDGNLEVLDSNGSSIGVITAPFTDDTWHLIEVYWQHSATGTITVWVDGSGTQWTSQDLNQGGSLSADDANYLLQYPGGTTSSFDDIYCYSGASGTGDFLGDCEVFRYQADTNSATPDVGDDLDLNVWAALGWTPGQAGSAQYTEYPRTGAVYADDVESGKNYRHGPHGDGNIDGTIKGAKWLHRLKGGGAGIYYKRYGNDGDGLTDEAVTLTTAYANYMTVSELATVVPLVTEHFALGFKNLDERKDLFCEEMWAFILHVPSGVTNVTVNAEPATAPAAAPLPAITAQRNIVASAITSIVTAAALLATVAIGKVVVAEPATAPASALLPTVTAQRSVSISAEPAAADAVTLLPTIVTAKDVVVDGEVAEVTAEAPLPTIKISRAVPGELATTTAGALSPTITGQKNVTVAGEVATSPATALLPTVGVSEAVAAEVAITTAEALLPVVRISKVVSAEVAETSATVLLPTVTAQRQVTISAEVAETTSEALLPEVLTGVDVIVNAEPATTVAEALIPVITAQKNVSIAAEPAMVSAATLLPTVHTGASVAGEPAGALASVLLPSVAIAEGIPGEIAEAMADALLPTVTATKNVLVAAEPAAALAVTPTPTIRISASVDALVATVTAEALLPVVKTGTVITAEPAEATANALLPTVIAGQSVSVVAVVATAVAEALLPEIATGLDALVDAQPAIADTAAPSPTITTVQAVSVDVVVALATAEALLPTVHIGKSVPAEVALADAAALAPTITTIWNVLALAVSAIADAVIPAPTVTGEEVAITPVVPGSAFAVEAAGLPQAISGIGFEVPSGEAVGSPALARGQAKAKRTVEGEARTDWPLPSGKAR